MARRPALPLLLLATCTPLVGQVTLGDLPDLARERLARQRPVQEKALAPFWADLELHYETNAELLDETIAEIVELGDGVVPLMLEKLTPADDSRAAGNLAANCARVLRHMDPASFTDGLLELLEGSSHTARRHAIRLLAHTGSRRAARTLTALLPSLDGPQRTEGVEALTELDADDAAAEVVALLPGSRRGLRTAILDYLATLTPPGFVEPVLAALREEGESGLLPRYVDYLAAAASDHAGAAEALLPLLTGDRLDPKDSRELVRALGSIAPEGHEPTIEALHTVLGERTGALGRAAALSLLALGDPKGVQILDANIERAMNARGGPSRSMLHLQRGELLFALEKWGEAFREFRRAINTGGGMIGRTGYLRMAQCEARQKDWDRVLRWLRQSRAGYEEILAAAVQDEALREALRHETILRWLNDLRDQGDR